MYQLFPHYKFDYHSYNSVIDKLLYFAAASNFADCNSLSSFDMRRDTQDPSCHMCSQRLSIEYWLVKSLLHLVWADRLRESHRKSALDWRAFSDSHSPVDLYLPQGAP